MKKIKMFKTLLNERVLSFNSTAQLISIKLDRHVHNFILQTPIIFVLSLYKNRGFRRQKCEGTKSEKLQKTMWNIMRIKCIALETSKF